MQYERQIDETTDLSSLTDQEIMRLMEGMDASVMNKVRSGRAAERSWNCGVAILGSARWHRSPCTHTSHTAERAIWGPDCARTANASR